jgi:hypothetical protein
MFLANALNEKDRIYHLLLGFDLGIRWARIIKRMEIEPFVVGATLYHYCEQALP